MRNEEEFLKSLMKEKFQIAGIAIGIDTIEAIGIVFAANKIVNLIPCGNIVKTIAKIGICVGGALAFEPLNRIIFDKIEEPLAKKANVPTLKEFTDAYDPTRTMEENSAEFEKVMMRYMEDEDNK